jgi:hypothetical protein
MISLVFLICTMNECRTISPPEVFLSVEGCTTTAQSMIVLNQEAAARGEIPDHTVIYTCHNWGDPA